MIDKMYNIFALKDLSTLNFFLNIEVVGESEGFHLSQQKYMHQLLEKAQLFEAKPINTYLPSGKIIFKTEGQPLDDYT